VVNIGHGEKVDRIEMKIRILSGACKHVLIAAKMGVSTAPGTKTATTTAPYFIYYYGTESKYM